MGVQPAERRCVEAEAAVILANLPSAVLVLRQGGVVAAANPAAEGLFSVSLPSLVGKPLAEHLAPHVPLSALIEQVQRHEVSLSKYGLQVALTKGRSVHVDAHIVPMVERPGCVLVTLQPCSVAQRFDRTRAQPGAGRSVAALARTLAHEVKNPLSGIRGAAQLLAPLAQDEDDQALVRLICDEADRICSLVDRMDAFTENLRLKREPCNIHAVLEHVRRIAQHGFGRHLRFVEHYDPSLPDVDGDRDRLVQVLLNLVKNAAEACPPEDGVVTLVTHYQHGLRVSDSGAGRVELPITVEVHDNGRGVPEGMVPHLFEPFVSDKAGGNGLGLALVAKIVADHGGIVSYVPGQGGAVFRLSLPAAPAPGAARPGNRPKGAGA